MDEKLRSVSHLLVRMRRVVGYFRRSAVANAILKEKQKQKLLQLPEHNLVIDVATRWNSAVDMISRYLEQQPVIYAALTFKKLRKREKDISSLSERELTSAEEFAAVLTPLKIATTVSDRTKMPSEINKEDISKGLRSKPSILFEGGSVQRSHNEEFKEG